MPTLCSRPLRWEDRRPVEWCPEDAALDSDYCPGHDPFAVTDERFEADLRAREAAA